MRKSDVRVKIRNPLTKTFHGGPVYQLGIVLLASIALVSCTQYGGKEPEEAAKSREVRSTPPPSLQTLPMESAKDDRSPSSSGRTKCPGDFVLIQAGSADGGNFCISKTSQEAMSWENASNSCESIKARLCYLAEWRLACNQKHAELSMGRAWEWVTVLYPGKGGVMGASGCGSYDGADVFSIGSRCCFR